MPDFPPPPSPLGLFNLDEGLTYIADGVYANQGDRDILITNQNSQQAQLSQFLASLDALTSAVSSATAQLSENIAALGLTLSGKLNSLAAALSAIDTSLTSRITTLDTNLQNTLTLLEATIEAFQGAGTLTAQNQMLALLQELVQVTSPERPRTIRADLTLEATTPQPRPSKEGP